MTTLITGAGLVGTSYALIARERGEDVVFLEVGPGRTLSSLVRRDRHRLHATGN